MNDFGISDEAIRRQCRSDGRVRSDSNKPLFPEKDFFDSCLEGAETIERDEKMAETVRNALM